MTAFKPRPLRDSITLTLGDREFTVFSPPQQVGMAIQEIAVVYDAAENGEDTTSIATPHLDALKAVEDETPFEAAVLGDTHTELVEAGAGWETISLVVKTVMVWVITQSKTAAADCFNNGGDPLESGKVRRRVPQDRQPRKPRK